MKTDETPREAEFYGEVTAPKTSPELADELRFAPLANLKGRAISAPAASLVSYLAGTYPRSTKNATRSNKPRKLELRLSLDKKGFKKPAPVSYRMFDGLRTSWKVAGLITEHAGYPGQLGFDSPGPLFGNMTRFRATPKLLKISGDHGVLVSEVQDHFFIEFDMPSELVQLTRPAGATRNTAEARNL